MANACCGRDAVNCHALSPEHSDCFNFVDGQTLGCPRSSTQSMFHRMAVWTKRFSIGQIISCASLTAWDFMMRGYDQGLSEITALACIVISSFDRFLPGFNAGYRTRQSSIGETGPNFGLSRNYVNLQPIGFVAYSNRRSFEMTSTMQPALCGKILSNEVNFPRLPSFEFCSHQVIIAGVN